MRQVVLYPGEDGYWVVECPSLPGCISQGRTKEEAIANVAPLEHHLIDQIVEQHILDEPEAMARAIRAARSVLRSATDIDVRTKATEYLATSVGRDVALVASYLEQTSQPRALERQRGNGRSIA